MMTGAMSSSAGAEDLPFLLEMLHAAACWRPGSCGDASHADRLMDEPALADMEDWGRPGDVGLVARRDGRPIGRADAPVIVRCAAAPAHVAPRTDRSASRRRHR